MAGCPDFWARGLAATVAPARDLSYIAVMKHAASFILGSLLVLATANIASAAEPASESAAKKKDAKAEPAPAAGKEVTLAGTFGCAKCSFKEADKCQNVLHVKHGGKVTSYELADNDVSKEHHDDICHAPGGKPATVKGTVSAAGDKKILTASQITLK
jgi:Family of unknown function (DUF6370)